VTSEQDVTRGRCVEYVGDDIPEIQVWHGHPGVAGDVLADLPSAEVIASMVGGPTMCFGPSDLRPLDETSYRQRGERIIAGMHPLEDRRVGDPITADGSHWP